MKNLHYGGPVVTTPGNLLPSRNSHSWADIGPENVIFVEDLRCPKNRRRGGPADTPRAHISDRSFGEGVTLCCLTRLMASRMLCFGGAAADLPGLRPFRRGSLILAQQCHTQRRPEAKRLHPRRHPENRVSGFSYRMRARSRLCAFTLKTQQVRPACAENHIFPIENCFGRRITTFI